MFIFIGMAVIAWGAWTHAFHVDQPASIGRTAVIVGAVLLALGLNASLRKAGGTNAGAGGSLWWLGVSVLVSCVSLMGLIYVTIVPDFGEIQQELVRGLLTALAISETIRLLLFGLARLRR